MSEKSMNRRIFLEKFAKVSTATIALGICVACPGPGPYFFNASVSSIGCDGEENSLSYGSNNENIYTKGLSVFFTGEPASNVSNSIDLFKIDGTLIEVNKTWNSSRSTLEISYVTPLDYDSSYKLVISKTIKDKEGNLLNNTEDVKFSTTSIELSRPTVKLQLGEEGAIEVKKLYIGSKPIDTFDIYAVETLDNIYLNSEYNPIDIAKFDLFVENHLFKLTGTSEGKAMLEISILYEHRIYKRELFLEVF